MSFAIFVFFLSIICENLILNLRISTYFYNFIINHCEQISGHSNQYSVWLSSLPPLYQGDGRINTSRFPNSFLIISPLICQLICAFETISDFVPALQRYVCKCYSWTVDSSLSFAIHMANQLNTNLCHFLLAQIALFVAMCKLNDWTYINYLSTLLFPHPLDLSTQPSLLGELSQTGHVSSGLFVMVPKRLCAMYNYLQFLTRLFQ